MTPRAALCALPTATAVVCGGACLSLPEAADAAEWSIVPSVRVSGDYADNPRMLERGAVSSRGTVGEIGAQILRRTALLDLSFEPRVRSARYTEDASLDGDDQFLDVSLSYLAERSQWQASLDLTRDTTLTSELTTTGLVQSNRRHEAVAFSGGPTFWLTERLTAGAQGNLLDNHYPDAAGTGLVDYEYRALSLFGGFDLTERNVIRLTLQGGELIVPGRSEPTRDATARLSWRFDADARWVLEAGAGPSYVDAALGSDTGAVFDAQAQRRGERWTFSAEASRSLTPTGRGVLTQRDRAALTVHRQLSEYVNARLSVQWVLNEDLRQQRSVELYEVSYGRVDFGLGWRFAEHWTLALSLGVAALEREALPRREAENHHASMSIVWKGRQHLL